jgi:hypothetical protein
MAPAPRLSSPVAPVIKYFLWVDYATPPILVLSHPPKPRRPPHRSEPAVEPITRVLRVIDPIAPASISFMAMAPLALPPVSVRSNQHRQRALLLCESILASAVLIPE